jgi:hypothetical protein
MKNPLTQQRKFRPAISHPFDKLELGHFSLDYPVVLGKSQSCYDRRFVALNPCYKALEFANPAGVDGSEPLIKLFTLAAMENPPKLLNELIHRLGCLAFRLDSS